MNQDSQKKILAFLKKVKEWQKHRQALEKAAKAKDPGDVRKQQTNIQLDHMHIDSDIDDMIKIATWHQSSLF